MNLSIFTDGASRGNPGPASYGFIIKDDKGSILKRMGKTIGITTNNVAEYTAVLEALKFVKNMGADYSSITVNSDSKLVAQQMSGNFKIKSKHLKPIIEQIKILSLELGGATFRHIPRNKNVLADQLANEALDASF